MGLCALLGLYCAFWLKSIPFPLQGDKHRSIKHDPDVLRDLRSTCAICPLGDTRITVTQRDIGADQERPGTVDQHIGRRRRAFLPAS